MSSEPDTSQIESSARTIKKLVPRPIKLAILSVRRAMEERRNKSRTVAEVFSEIYAGHKWGDGEAGEAFDSGHGTSQAAVALPYVDAVAQDLRQRGLYGTHAVDLGCGDYRIGRQLRPLFESYTGVDVVPSLVEHLNSKHGNATTTFVERDLVEDQLPQGDVAFLRQVLQHLSNAQIHRILAKLNDYRVTYLTEHHPSNGKLRRANLDKVHGGGIRLFKSSGVFVDQPPFDSLGLRCHLLLEVPGHGFSVDADPGMIRTYAVSAGDADV